MFEISKGSYSSLYSHLFQLASSQHNIIGLMKTLLRNFLLLFFLILLSSIDKTGFFIIAFQICSKLCVSEMLGLSLKLENKILVFGNWKLLGDGELL